VLGVGVFRGVLGLLFSFLMSCLAALLALPHFDVHALVDRDHSLFRESLLGPLLEKPMLEFDRNVQWFRGGLVFEAHRLLYHSGRTLRCPRSCVW